MRSLLHVVRGTSEAGKDLPEILPALTNIGVRFRRGQVALVAGQPGRGKTALALWYAIKAAGDEPVLYISADSDMGTMANRSAAILTNRTVNDVKALRAAGEVGEVEAALTSLQRRVRIETDPNPTIDGIWEETHAFIEMFGVAPSLIVVDVLMSVYTGNDSSWQGLLDTMTAFHTLSRKTESAVVVLHHTSEDSSSPTRPGPMKSIIGKISQFPETVLTVAIDGDHYWVASVKNRDGGVSDAKAESPVQLFVDAETMSFFNTQQELDLHRRRRQWQ
jgi:RecA-family ATPase